MAVLFFVFAAAAFRLRPRDFEFPLEPDFDWQRVQEWVSFLSTFDVSSLPKPAPHVYLDGQFIVYAATDIFLRWIVPLSATLRGFFPNDLSYAFGAAILTNIVAYAAACAIFYSAMLRLTANVAISALMAAGLFLAPQMLDINIGRADFLITLPLMMIFYCSCLLLLAEQRNIHAVVLGVALAFIATIKISGLVFGIIPALAALSSLRFKAAWVKRMASFAAISLLVFAVAYFALMGRYFYYLSTDDIVELYQLAIIEVGKWTPFQSTSTWYYNIDLLLGGGMPFIVLYLACALVVAYLAIKQQSRPAIFLALMFVVFSVMGTFSLKYNRGGYHLLPIFFAMIGVAAAAILNFRMNRYLRLAILAPAGLALAVGVAGAIEHYEKIVSKRNDDYTAAQLVKRAPRDWLRAHIPAGTTICIQTSSQWTIPPLDGFHAIYGPLDLPYLDPEEMSRTYPPNLDNLKAACPVIITSDWHRSLFNGIFVKYSPALAAKWEEFFTALNGRYPPIVFSSPVSTHAKHIYINDLR